VFDGMNWNAAGQWEDKNGNWEGGMHEGMGGKWEDSKGNWESVNGPGGMGQGMPDMSAAFGAIQ
jgi:hypothetical protein